MGRPVGAAGLALIKRFEGCRLRAYKPVRTERYWTIGWGHYGADVEEGQVITQAEADDLLAEDVQHCADAVDSPRYVPLTARLNDNQRDALISFAYNCGAGNLRTLCRDRGLEEIRDAMGLYNKSGGAVLPGLARRRAAEQALFDTPAARAELDNTPSSAHSEGVAWCVAQGILTGNGQGNLMLSQPVTRQQLCTILFRFAHSLSGDFK